MFQSIEFMQPLRNFLVQYPDLQPGETLEIGYMTIADPTENIKSPEGEAMAFVGTSTVDTTFNIAGKQTNSEQSNFMLIIRRFTSINEQRRDIGDFLINYIRWINYANSRRGLADEHPDLPKFSMTPIESITSNGGMPTAVSVEDNVDEFSLNLICSYETVYE